MRGPPNAMTTETRTAVYGRVSTEDQAERFGLASQVSELQALARQRGYTIPAGGEFIDDGASGADLDRPALTRLREAIRRRLFDVVLIHDPDRLARKLSLQLLLMEEFERAGVRVEFKTTPKGDSPETQLLLHMRGAIAEFERLKILERTSRGRKEKARRGRRPGGPTPFGYRPDPKVSGALIVHPDEAATVRMMFDWLVTQQQSTRQITMELRRLGLRPPRAPAWTRASVRFVLTNETYAGRAWFNRRDESRGRVRMRPPSEWFAISVPAIISEALFHTAQVQLRRNRSRFSGRPPSRVFLLRGLLRCEGCGRAYTGASMYGTAVYRCTGRDRLEGVTPCRAKAQPADNVERLIWDTVVGILRNPQVLDEKVAAHRARLEDRAVEARSGLDVLIRERADLARQERRLLDLYLQESLPLPGVRERLEGIGRRKAGLEEQITTAQRHLVSQDAEKARQDGIRRFCRLALRGLDTLTLEGRQHLLRALIDQVVIGDSQIEIRGVLPGRSLPPVGARNCPKPLAALPVEDGQDPLDLGVEVEGARVAARQAVDRPLDGQGFQGHAPGPVLPAFDGPDRCLGQVGCWAGILAQLSPELPFDAGVDGRADGRCLLLLPIRGLDPGDGLRDGCEHILGIPGPRTGEDLKHRGLKVPALLLGVPGPQGRLGNDVQDGGYGGEPLSFDRVEPVTPRGLRRRRKIRRHLRPPCRRGGASGSRVRPSYPAHPQRPQSP
jgi:site-specific DNA recombinase